MTSPFAAADSRDGRPLSAGRQPYQVSVLSAASLAVGAALLAVAYLAYRPALQMTALGGDNFYVLSWIHSASLASLLEMDPAYYPEWRPLAYLVLWLTHRVIPLDMIWMHHLINIGLWAVVAWISYLVSARLTGARWAAILAAGLLLLDHRSQSAMYWISERQSSLAAIFGLWALWLIVRDDHRFTTRSSATGLILLLIASPLCKAYGLAFAGAVAAYGATQRRRDLVCCGALAFAIYATLRLVLAGGALGPYCEEMGFFADQQVRCFSPAEPSTWLQSAYNVFAAMVGTPLKGLFTARGRLDVEPVRLLVGLLITLLAAKGLRYGPPSTRLFVLVALGNALLNFVVFRERNLVIGVAAVTIVAGIGLATWERRVHSAPWHRWLPVAAAAMIALLLVRAVVHRHRMMTFEVSHSFGLEPCNVRFRQYPYGERFVPLIKRAYGLEDPDCTGVP